LLFVLLFSLYFQQSCLASFRRKPQNKRQYSTSKKSSGQHRRRAQQFAAERFGNSGGEKTSLNYTENVTKQPAIVAFKDENIFHKKREISILTMKKKQQG
jgi:hypothetical protein